MNIKQLLEYGTNLIKENNIEEAFLKARVLLSYVLNKEKEYLITHDLEEISEINNREYEKCVNRLIQKEPIQYITKKQEFYGIDFFINNNVLIPQPDTEILVEETINICKNQFKDEVTILDLCTGSGAIGIAIAENIDNSKIALSDISSKALEVAKLNVNNHNLQNKIKIIQSDLFETINEKYNIIVSNPPYIKTDVIKTLSKEVQNEPEIALDGGKDGLELYTKIIKEGHKYLKENGYLCLEIGYDQKEDVIKLLKKSKKYKEIYSKKDLGDNDRIIVCKKN